jgi:hydrogenase expression/formation protein HypC
MCLAIPAKVVEIGKDKEGARAKAKAKADFGGVSREIDISLVDAKVGDYVMVHAGFAIEIMDEHEAEETLELWKEMLEKCSDTETKS